MIGRGNKGMKITCQATSIPADRVPDMSKRKTLNLLLLGALSLPTAGMLVPYGSFLVPPGYVFCFCILVTKSFKFNLCVKLRFLVLTCISNM